MIKNIYRRLEKEVSGEIAFNFVSEISRNHRIQASPGIRAAVEYSVDTLKGYGLDAEVHSYPADDKTYSWSSLHFREWSCDGAELKLVYPEDEARYLARWSESKISLIQRSHPTPEGGVEAEVVVLDKGEEERDYRKLDVAGKIVVTNGDIGRVHELAVERFGAIGIIYDGMFVSPPVKPEGALADALKYTSFWWSGDEKPAFGFVMSPRQGRRLRELVKKQEKAKDPVKVWSKVDSKLYKGEIENAVVTIPGETDEVVMVVAHICHPQPSANDNASGSSAAMEAARAIHALISNGELSKPKRTIMFTLVPEMTGTYNYLAANESDIPKMVAALNLDMVGEDQDKCKSVMIVERTPEATPSFVNALMEAIFDEVKAEVSNLGGSSKYPLFRHAVSPFSGGSDHYIYSDPTVGVPCPMIIQWPDLFYHTSWDTLEKVDPESLRKVALMTATYAYSIANAGPEDAVWLVNEVASRLKAGIVGSLQGLVTDAVGSSEADSDLGRGLAEALAKLKKVASYRAGRGVEALRTVRRIAGEDAEYLALEGRLVSGFERLVKVERERAEDTLREYARVKGLDPLPPVRSGRPKRREREAAGIVPRRLFMGPVSTRPWIRKLSAEDRDALRELGKGHPRGRSMATTAMFWTDGERSLLEVSNLVELERGETDLEFLIGYYGFLRRMGLVEYVGER